MKHTLSVLVENKPGALMRVTSMFARRGFNIDSLAVGETEDANLSRMTFVVKGDDAVLDQVRKQLDKVVTVVKVHDISSEDYAATGADAALTEGIIDHLRTIDGTVVSAVVRDQPDSNRAARKVSMRSTDGQVDVSAIARLHGGGGHRRAAGFGTDLEFEQVVEFLIGEIDSQLCKGTTIIMRKWTR